MAMSLKSMVNKINKKTAFAILSMIVTMATFVCAVFSCLQPVLSRIVASPSDISGVPVGANISFKEDYPFADAQEEAADVQEAAETQEESDAPYLKIRYKIRYITSPYTNAVSRFAYLVKERSTEKNPLAPAYYNIHGTFNRLINKNLMENDENNVYRLENGVMVYMNDWQMAENAADNVIDFAGWLKNLNIDFIYVQTASKEDDSIVSFPPIVKKNYAEDVQKFTESLASNDIKYLDIKKLLLSKNDRFFDWFYKTDHHCTVRAGIAAAGQIVECMADDFGYDVDKSVCDLSKYKSVVYKEYFLGSMGRKTSFGYTKADDFEILYPEFDTNFRIEILTEAIDKTGSFEDTMIDKTYIKSNDYGNDYVAFLYGDQSLIKITNNTCHNGVHVLVLKQSKANNINPYLACVVEQLDIIDPRHFDGSIRTYIEKTMPNLVIICATPDSDSESTWTLK